MKIKIILYGKTTESYLKEGIDIYLKRLKHYIPLNWHEIPETTANNKSPLQHQENAMNASLKFVNQNDILILLDENGKQFSSTAFADFLQKKMNTSTHDLVFMVGGAFGFHKSLYDRAQFIISLSKMTFTHQMIRLLFIEQLYRAMTIIRNEKYHH